MTSTASPSAAMPPPSTNPSTGAQYPLSLDELHRYVRQEACNRAEPGVIPPNTPSSIFIGQRRLKGGDDDDATVRLMFRCVWPPKSVSRHVIIHMKPSVPEATLALKLCDVLEIPASGGVITKLMPEFMPGHQPVPTPGTEDNFAEKFEALGFTMAGFTEVIVEQMGHCTSCGCRVNIGPETLQIIRNWCFRVETRCKECHKTKGVNENVIETCIVDKDGQVLARGFKEFGDDSHSTTT